MSEARESPSVARDVVPSRTRHALTSFCPFLPFYPFKRWLTPVLYMSEARDAPKSQRSVGRKCQHYKPQRRSTQGAVQVFTLHAPRSTQVPALHSAGVHASSARRAMLPLCPFLYCGQARGGQSLRWQQPYAQHRFAVAEHIQRSGAHVGVAAQRSGTLVLANFVSFSHWPLAEAATPETAHGLT